MPKSVRTQIVEAVAGNLTKIKAGNPVPNLSDGHKFLGTVRSVNRALVALNDDEFPALFVVDPVETGRHLLADVLQQTLQMTIAGIVRTTKNATGRRPDPHSVTVLDNLIDDTRSVLANDPTVGGLARRTRIPRLEANTSTDVDSLAFDTTFEVDYIELVDTGADSSIVLPEALLADPASNFLTPTMPWGETVLNSLFNAFRTIPGIVWVERARNWPIPLEQISARYTPGIWFKDVTESYQYGGSTDTKKISAISCVLLAVETDLDSYPSPAVDNWVAALKNCVGAKPNADLGGRIATMDIQAIRTERCEYPLVAIELDLQLMYMQSFAVS
jgi:hypothetical protein